MCTQSALQRHRVVVAAYRGDLSRARDLLHHGADVNARMSDKTPLMKSLEPFIGPPALDALPDQNVDV